MSKLAYGPKNHRNAEKSKEFYLNTTIIQYNTKDVIKYIELFYEAAISAGGLGGCCTGTGAGTPISAVSYLNDIHKQSMGKHISRL